MPRKYNKTSRKVSYDEPTQRVKYQEKSCKMWECKVCCQKYDANQ